MIQKSRFPNLSSIWSHPFLVTSADSKEHLRVGGCEPGQAVQQKALPGTAGSHERQEAATPGAPRWFCVFFFFFFRWGGLGGEKIVSGKAVLYGLWNANTYNNMVVVGGALIGDLWLVGHAWRSGLMFVVDATEDVLGVTRLHHVALTGFWGEGFLGCDIDVRCGCYRRCSWCHAFASCGTNRVWGGGLWCRLLSACLIYRNIETFVWCRFDGTFCLPADWMVKWEALSAQSAGHCKCCPIRIFLSVWRCFLPWDSQVVCWRWHVEKEKKRKNSKLLFALKHDTTQDNLKIL